MELLFDIIIILTFAVGIILITTKFKLPSLIGYLLTGIIIGPSLLGLVSNLEEIEILAEIGIMLLMFTIGLEFSIEKIKQMQFNFIFFGGLQVTITWILTGLILYLYEFNLSQAIFSGFILALSSTAIILKSLKDKGKIDSPYGLKVTGILLFQDAALIPFLILMPSIVSSNELVSLTILQNILISVAGIAALLLIGRLIIPRVFDVIMNLRMPELFMISIFVIIFGIAFSAYKLGASLAMGAFIAGVILSDTNHAHHVNTELIPSRHLFNSIFFISIGMFINLDFIISNVISILIFTFLIIVVKSLIIYSIFRFSSHSKSEGLLTAFTLAHIGEFSFILLKLSEDANLFSEFYYQLFLSSAVFSMFAIPLLVHYGEKFSAKNEFRSLVKEDDKIKKLQNHTIIAGFGINGQNISRTLKLLGVPYNIIELNPITVKKFKQMGYHIHLGNLDRSENLVSMGIKDALLLIIAISDLEATKRSILIAKSINKKIKIIVRANYLSQVESIYKLGADLVIAQDMETSLSFLFHILKFYNLPDHVIRLQTNILRKEHYKFFTKTDFDEKWKITSFDDLQKDNEIFFISSASKLLDKSINELKPVVDDIVKIIGIIRNDVVINDNIEEIKLQPFDTIIFFGNHMNIQRSIKWFEENN